MKDEKYSLFKIVIFTILLTGFVAAIYGFGIYLFSAIMPNMKKDLHFSYSEAGLVTGIAQVSFMIFAVLGGIVSSRIGGVLTCIISVFFSGIILITIPFLDNFVFISIALILLGGMAASGYVPIVDILSNFIDYKHRGKVMGLISSGTSFGVFINGLIIPFFLINFNWKYIWFALGGITLAWVFTSIFIFRHYNVLKIKVVSGKTKKIEKINIYQPIVIVIFVLTFLNGFTVMPFQNFLAPFLQDELGYSVTLSSQIWSAIGFFGMLSGFLMGALSDRIGIKLTLLITYFLLAMSSVLVIFHDSNIVLWFAAIAFSFAFYPIFGLVPAYVSKKFGSVKATLIFSIANVTLGIGGMLGNTVGGYIKTLTGSFVFVYILIGICSVLGIFLVLFLSSENKNESNILQ